jgi:hypothetical protein
LLFFLPTHAQTGAQNEHGHLLSFREARAAKLRCE